MTADEWLAANPTATLREAFEAGGLSPKARSCIALRKQRMSTRQIAATLSLNHSTVHRHLHAAGLAETHVGGLADRVREYLRTNGPQTRLVITAALGKSAGVRLSDTAGVAVVAWVATAGRPAAVYGLSARPSVPRPKRQKPVRRRRVAAPVERPTPPPTAGLTLQNVWLSAER